MQLTYIKGLNKKTVQQLWSNTDRITQLYLYWGLYDDYIMKLQQEQHLTVIRLKIL